MKLALLGFFFCLLTNWLHAQTDTLSKKNDTVLTLVGVTISNKDFKLFTGKKLMVGKGSDENGWFKTISFNSIFDWYGITYSITSAILGSKDIETAEEKKLRENNLLRECVQAEGILYIKKIKKYGDEQRGYSYIAILQSRPGKPATNYRCNIQLALKTRELFLSNE